MQVEKTSPKNSESVGQVGNRNLSAPNTIRRKTHTVYGIHFVLDLHKSRKSMAVYSRRSDPVVEGFLEEGTFELR